MIFSMTKHDNTAKHHNSLYIGEFCIIFLILEQYNKFSIDFISILMQILVSGNHHCFSGEEKLRIRNHANTEVQAEFG